MDLKRYTGFVAPAVPQQGTSTLLLNMERLPFCLYV